MRGYGAGCWRGRHALCSDSELRHAPGHGRREALVCYRADPAAGSTFCQLLRARLLELCLFYDFLRLSPAGRGGVGAAGAEVHGDGGDGDGEGTPSRRRRKLEPELASAPDRDAQPVLIPDRGLDGLGDFSCRKFSSQMITCHWLIIHRVG